MNPATNKARTMRVVLQICDGPDLGRKILLRMRHELKVGRTSWADFVCEHDTKMSRVHFKVVTDSVGCYVEDLGSSNGTQLNGEKVENERLKHGDRIQAGNTTFQVIIEGDRPNLTGSYVGSMPQEGGGGGQASGGKVLYGRSKCFSGLMKYTIAAAAVEPAVLAQQLSKSWPLYLMADFNRMGGQQPEDLEKAEIIFDWLPPVVAQEYPVFFGQTDTEETFHLIAEFFAKDSLVCLFSKANREQVLEHVRISARSRRHSGDDTPGMFGICWPSVIGAMLPHGDQSLVERIMSGIEAVLIYPPEDPEECLLLGNEQIEKVLQAQGYELDPDSQQPTDEEADADEGQAADPKAKK